MDKLPPERLIDIASSLNLASLNSLVQTSKRSYYTLSGELYTRALRHDRNAGWPYYLVRAILLNREANSLRALLEGTTLQEINKAVIPIQEIIPRDAWELLGFTSTTVVTPFRPPVTHTTSILHIACQLCDEVVVSLVLERGADRSVLDSHGWSPLHLAGYSGKIGIMKLLIDAGADVNITVGGGRRSNILRDDTETTPLHQAVRQGYIPAVELLLEAGADPKARYPRQDSDTLGVAAEKGNLKLLQHLLKIGCFDRLSVTKALGLSVKTDSTQSVRLLLAAGGDPQVPLWSAVSADSYENVQLLIESGADPQRSPLVLNIVRSLKVTQTILAKCPGLCASCRPTIFTGTPLEALYESAQYELYANQNEMEAVALMLVEDGCPIREPDPINEDNDRLTHNRNILEDAALWGHLRVIEAILARKPALLNLRHRDGYYAIHGAAFSASKNKLACFKLLVEKGADIHAKNDYGQTVLGCLYSMSLQKAGTPRPTSQNAQVTQYLIDLGIDIHEPSNGASPIIHALEMENDQSAIVLMNAGANINDKSRTGLTTLQLAAQYGCLETMERLLQSEDVVTLLGNDPRRPLLHTVVQEALNKHQAVKGYAKMMGHLLLGHWDISVEEAAGEEAAKLEPLAHAGQMEVIRRLCARGIVDPGDRGSTGSTAFDKIRNSRRSPGQEEVADLFAEADQKWPRPLTHFEKMLARRAASGNVARTDHR